MEMTIFSSPFFVVLTFPSDNTFRCEVCQLSLASFVKWDKPISLPIPPLPPQWTVVLFLQCQRYC